MHLIELARLNDICVCNSDQVVNKFVILKPVLGHAPGGMIGKGIHQSNYINYSSTTCN